MIAWLKEVKLKVSFYFIDRAPLAQAFIFSIKINCRSRKLRRRFDQSSLLGWIYEWVLRWNYSYSSHLAITSSVGAYWYLDDDLKLAGRLQNWSWLCWTQMIAFLANILIEWLWVSRAPAIMQWSILLISRVECGMCLHSMNLSWAPGQAGLWDLCLERKMSLDLRISWYIYFWDWGDFHCLASVALGSS